jgi:hypothetical protein
MDRPIEGYDAVNRFLHQQLMRQKARLVAQHEQHASTPDRDLTLRKISYLASCLDMTSRLQKMGESRDIADQPRGLQRAYG